MVISHIEPPLYTSSTRVFIALFMHKTMGLEQFVHTVFLVTSVTNHGLGTMVLYTVFYGCFLYSLNMKKKYIKFKAFNSSHSGKPNIFYFRGAKFKPCLHPFVCTQMSFGLRLIFIFKSVCVMFVDPRIFTLSSTGHATSRRITTSTPPNPTSSCMCQEGKE